MKAINPKIFGLFAFALVGILIGGCKTTGDMTKRDTFSKGSAIEIENPIDLKDFLVRAGVTFDWNTGVPIIRGGEPLYVVDGVRLGHNYYDVARSINVNDIGSVEVIKNAGEGLMYGRDSGNGVIVIKTKTGA